MAYQQSITQLARTYFVDYWLAYDSAFRQKRANNPLLRWDADDNQLFIRYLRTAPVLAAASLPVTSADTSHSRTSTHASSSQASSLSHVTCFNCGQYGHKIQNCKYAQTTHNTLPSATYGAQALPMPAAQTYPDNTYTHQAFLAPQRAPMRNQQRAGNTSGFGFDWNNGLQCPPGCRRDHRCSHCTEPHPRHRCRKYPPNQHNSQNQHNQHNQYNQQNQHCV